jgi:hypothetical protein
MNQMIIEQCRSQGLGGHDREREAKIRKEYSIELWTDLDEEKTYLDYHPSKLV